ncbi:MAG: choice-of-anchor D domain-containing protein [Terriglobales bacterium]
MGTKALGLFLVSYTLVTIGCGGIPAATTPAAATTATTSTVAVETARRASTVWSVSPSSIAFGQVTVGASSTQSVTITNTSATTASIDSASLNGAGFQLAVTTFPISVKAGASTMLQVIFAPSSTGSSSGNLSLTTSNSSAVSVALSGSGAAAVVPVQHSVTLNWMASPSVVDGYYIYRGTQSGGPYTRLNASPTPATTFQDATVSSGTTYYYAVTAVAGSLESTQTAQIAAAVPSP